MGEEGEMMLVDERKEEKRGEDGERGETGKDRGEEKRGRW